MIDYIDRNALYAEIVSWRCDPCIASGNDHNRVMCRACDIGDILDLIENFQIDDIKLVKTGHWEKAQEKPYFRKHFDVVSCSVCHVKGNRKYKYCPNCGADMRKEENDE